MTELSNASKGMKYLEINLNQELKDLHRVMDSEVEFWVDIPHHLLTC